MYFDLLLILWMSVNEAVPVITVVIDRDVEDTFEPDPLYRLSRVQFMSPDSGQLLRLPERVFTQICEVASAESGAVAISSARRGSVIRSDARRQLSCVLSWASKADNEAAQMMMENRVRLVFLLNTLGGCVQTERKLVRYANRVRRNGGEVWAFGREKVNSAGAMLFMSADPDRRYLDEHTTLLFHLSTFAREDCSHKRTTPQISRSRSQEIADLRRILSSSVSHDSYASHIRNLVKKKDLAAPLGQDVDVIFSAREAQRYWSVEVHKPQRLLSIYTGLLGANKQPERILAPRSARPVRRFFGA